MDNLPPADTCCAICNNLCIQECLKCHKCKRSIHIICSNLPVYAIVNFFNTRCQYTCEECARNQQGDDCDRLFALVYTIIEREREARQQQQLEQKDAENIVDDANGLDNKNDESIVSNEPSLPNHKTKHSAGKQGDTRTTVVSGNQANNQRKTKVCHFYKNNKCKYGLRGRDCPYAHPKLCNRYNVNGCDPVRGCKKGKDCTFLHPPICYGSERKRECLNVECKRLHLKGTRRYPSDQTTTEQQARQQAVPAKPLPLPWSAIPPPAPQPHNVWVSGPPHHVGKHQADSTESFLLQQMQQVQQQIVHALKTMPWQWGPTHPLQGYQQQQVATTPTAFIK